MTTDVRAATVHALCDELDTALGRVKHCVDQLTDDQVWWRPRPEMNAIGNLMLHLAGNVRQFITSAVGGEPDDRDRPAEFAERRPLPKAELLAILTAGVNRAKSALRGATAEALCGPIAVKGREWTGIQAAVRSVAHFHGHAQEIIHMTRELLGEKYAYAGPR